MGVSTNWHTKDTDDYAYIYDGVRCMYGLGHKEKVWTFDINTGLFPCPLVALERTRSTRVHVLTGSPTDGRHLC